MIMSNIVSLDIGVLQLLLELGHLIAARELRSKALCGKIIITDVTAAET